MRSHHITAKILVTLIAFVLVGVSAVAGGTWVKTRIGLHEKDSDPLASGKAVYREKDFGLRRTLRVEVEGVQSATNVEVFVDSVNVGSISLILGAGQLEIDTRDGDSVPVIVFGSVVKVRDSGDGHVILKGKNH